ncbi:MAG: hypothetical protein ACOC56_02185 [Atribacterota bacterium]
MASIVVDSNTFPDIVASYLLDIMINDSEIENELFDEILEKLQRGGMKSYLMNYFLQMDGESRIKYKMIKQTLRNETNQKSVITIREVK